MEINFIDIILTSILIGIPETFLLVFIILIFLKRYEFLYRNNIKKNIFKVGVFVVLPHVVFAVTTFYLDINVWLRAFMNTIMLAFLTYAILGYFSKTYSTKENIIDIGKVYMSSLLSMVSLCILERSTVVLSEYLFGFNMIVSKATPLINFIFAIPTRIVMFFIVFLVYIKVNTRENLILNTIWKEKKYFKKTILIQVILNIFLFGIIYNKLIINEFLINLDQEVSTFIVFLIIIIVVISNLLPWFIIYTIKLKQASMLEKNLK